MKAIASLALVTLGLAIPGTALAGANKTWVSGSGTDSGTCQFAAPCRSFQYALGQTSAGGEIDVKDAGGYGTVVIDKAISIVAADGVLATISVPAGGTGITVNAGYDNNVVISGLTIDGHLLGGTGISVSSSTTMTKLSVKNLNVGIKIANGRPSTVQDSNLINNQAGVATLNAYVYIVNNLFAKNRLGLDNPSYYGGSVDNVFVTNDTDYRNTPFAVDKH